MAQSGSTLSTLWHHWGPPSSPWKQQSSFVIYSYSVLHTALLTQFEFSHSLCSQMPATAFQSPTIWRGSALSDFRRREECFRSMHAVIQDIWPKWHHRQESKKERKRWRGRITVVVSITSEIDGAAASLSAPFLQAVSPVCVWECVCALSALWHLSWPTFSRFYHITS